MPDITGILSTFKKELFSGRYMIVIFIWLVALVLLPDDVKIFVNQKIEIPYSYQLLAFSASVLLYVVLSYIFIKLKILFKSFKEKNKKRKIEEKFIKIISELSESEANILVYLVLSGYGFISFDAGKIPNEIHSLVSKHLIIQAEYPSLYTSRCTYILVPPFEPILKKHIKIQSTQENNES